MGSKDVHLANTSDIQDGEMKEFLVDETRILVARVRDQFHAVSATCPHYGAPLVEGALCGTRVVCPWHHAVFNVVSGDLEEPPALDGLVSYYTRVEGEQVIVSVPDETPDRRTAPMAAYDPSHARIAHPTIGPTSVKIIYTAMRNRSGCRFDPKSSLASTISSFCSTER
jgi:nitrite reductase/ring-hydroxylating ferredoxin subunit